jgi:hypothetical protein
VFSTCAPVAPFCGQFPDQLVPKHPAPPRSWRRGWLYAAAALVFAGYLLFAHGCHGDEDNELFAAGRDVVGGR